VLTTRAAEPDADAAVDDVEVGTTIEEAVAPPLVGSAIDPAVGSAPIPAPPAPTIDLAGAQAAEDDDSDDFFASLREATSEHAVLTPSEERLFDTDDDDDRDSSFRDVFRRRR
jgi:hypothetical protein